MELVRDKQYEDALALLYYEYTRKPRDEVQRSIDHLEEKLSAQYVQQLGGAQMDIQSTGAFTGSLTEFEQGVLQNIPQARFVNIVTFIKDYSKQYSRVAAALARLATLNAITVSELTGRDMDAPIRRRSLPPNSFTATQEKEDLSMLSIDTAKLDLCVETLRKEAGPMLIACDIWGKDAMSLGGFNSQPVAVALFHEVTKYLLGALEQSKFPTLKDFYLLPIETGYVVVIHYKGYNWGMALTSEMSLGRLFSISLPKIIAMFKEMVDSAR